jgi:hypothetical protein
MVVHINLKKGFLEGAGTASGACHGERILWILKNG